jgi:SAM-dependent methyltransferase
LSEDKTDVGEDQDLSGSSPWVTYRTIRIPPDERRTVAWRHIARYLERFMPAATGSVLDLGAGYCDFINNIRAPKRVAFDANPDFAEYAQGDVEFELGDCTDLSRFPDGSFDVVFASNLVEHLDSAAAARLLGEVRRVLRPLGRLILVQPNFRLRPGEYFDDYTHVSIYTDRSLCGFLQSEGFTILEAKARFLPLTFRSRLAIGAHLVPFYLRSPLKPMAGQMLVVATVEGDRVA